MAVDFQVVFPQTVISLTKVTRVPGMLPQTLDITGVDFRSVDQVLINAIPAPEVVVVSKTRLLAQVPTALRQSALSSVTVTSSQLTLSKSSLIKFQIGPVPSKVSGILRLMQIFLKILLTKPGTDIFAPRIGGNGLKNLGLTFGSDQGGSIVSDFIIAVQNTQRQIIAIQSRDPSVPRDERLLSAKTTAATYNRSESALITTVELTSQAGTAATANLMM